jgi:hypothetical protein
VNVLNLGNLVDELDLTKELRFGVSGTERPHPSLPRTWAIQKEILACSAPIGLDVIGSHSSVFSKRPSRKHAIQKLTSRERLGRERQGLITPMNCGFLHER